MSDSCVFEREKESQTFLLERNKLSQTVALVFFFFLGLAVTALASASSSASLLSSTHRKLLLTLAEKHLLPSLNNFSHWSITLVKPSVLNFYPTALDS